MTKPITKYFEDGHFYSTIPSTEVIESHTPEGFDSIVESDVIDYNIRRQESILTSILEMLKTNPFPKDKTTGCRYYYDNPFFNISDGYYYMGFLKTQKPKRIIEVGSGFSSAILLDAMNQDSSFQPEVTFIEPYNERLLSLITDDDKANCRIIKDFVQNVDSTLFQQLDSGDLLFIDSSHVSKYGSDLNHLLFKIIPCLKNGVFVHFHDIFDNFEYPQHWLQQGRYWNENYLIRAFLSYNDTWDIVLFARFIHNYFGDQIKSHAPYVNDLPGGSIYIQKKS